MIVDAYSKFLEVIPIPYATSANTVPALRHVFSYFALPEHLVTDNGSQFTSAEFQKFLKDNDICCGSNFTFGLNFLNQFKFFKLV